MDQTPTKQNSKAIKLLIIISILGCGAILATLFSSPVWIIWSNLIFLLWGFAIGQIIIDRTNITNQTLRTVLTVIIGIIFASVLYYVLQNSLPLFWSHSDLSIDPL